MQYSKKKNAIELLIFKIFIKVCIEKVNIELIRMVLGLENTMGTDHCPITKVYPPFPWKIVSWFMTK
jgi:hypothetical protein